MTGVDAEAPPSPPAPTEAQSTALTEPLRLLPHAEDSQDDLRARLLTYLGLAIKHKYLVAVVVGIALVGGVIVTLRTPKIYSASTTIKIDRAAPQVVKGPPGQSDVAIDDSAQFYETQYELIRSRQLADRVAGALDLARSDFLPVAQPSLWRRLLGAAAPSAGPGLDADAIRKRRTKAVGRILSGLNVQPVGQSLIVRITYSGLDPEWAQRISIGVAEQFAKMSLDLRFSATTYARDFLQQRLEEMKGKLEASEKQMIGYAQKQGILDVDNKEPQIFAEMAGLQTAYDAALTNRVQLEQSWRQSQASGAEALPQVMSDGLIETARNRLAVLKANYQDKLTVLKPAFPEMLALQSQIAATERDVKTQIALIKRSIDDQYEAALADEKALGGRLADLKSEALDRRRLSVDYTILKREVDTNRSLYDGLLQQYRQLGVASDAESNNVTVVDRALLPGEPNSPSLINNLTIAAALGLVAAAGCIGLIEVLDDTFKTPEDIEERLGLTVVGVIPVYKDPEHKRSAIAEVMEDPTSPLAESYRSLRTAVQFSTSDGAPKSMLVTSSRPGEGKSTTAASIAVNFAQLGMRVLLIDADLRNPSMHHVLGVDNSFGLSNYLSGAVAGLGDDDEEGRRLVKLAKPQGIHVMTSGPLPPNPAELLAGPKLRVLLGTAASFFDIVIVDGPPIMGLADALLLASAVEGSLLVIESAKTRREVVRDALKRLHYARARLVGCALNKYHPKHATSSYGYGYGYGYGWNYGYGAGSEKYIYGRAPKPALSETHET